MFNKFGFMPVVVGDTPKEELFEQVKAVRRLCIGEGEGMVEQVVMSPQFTVAETRQTILTVVITPAMIGFDNFHRNARRLEVLNPELWKFRIEEYLPGYTIDWNPPEVALRLAVQYEGNKQEYEHYVVATKPIHLGRYDWMFSFGNFVDNPKVQNFDVVRLPRAADDDRANFHANLDFVFQLCKL